MTSDTERSAIYHVTQRLSVRFPMVDAAVVGRVVQETQRRFDAHPIREFVPILVEDAARDVLRVLPEAGMGSGHAGGRGRIAEPGLRVIGVPRR